MALRVFRLLNVVKSTGSDYQAENYLAQGYEEITGVEGVEVTQTNSDASEAQVAKVSPLEDKTIEELKAILADKGTEFSAKAKKAELIKLINEAG